MIFWWGCWSRTGRREGLGGAVSGFQWGEEKPASFPTTQHPRWDHYGGFPTCCAVQETGTRHTTLTPRGLQTQLETSLPLPQSIHKPPSPTHPPIYTTSIAGKTTGLPVTMLFNTKTFLFILVSDRQQNSGALRSQVQ